MDYKKEDIEELLRIRETYYQRQIQEGFLNPSEAVRDALDLPLENQQRRAARQNMSLDDWRKISLIRTVKMIKDVEAQDLAFKSGTLKFADPAEMPRWADEPLFEGSTLTHIYSDPEGSGADQSSKP